MIDIFKKWVYSQRISKPKNTLMKKFLALLFFALPIHALAFNCYDIPLPDNVQLSELETCDIQNGLAVISDGNDKYGYVNKKGKIVITPKFDKAWQFQDGLALVQWGKKWGYIDLTGNFAIKPIYDEAWGFSDGLAKVQKNGKVGFINTKGKVVIPIKYDNSYHWFDDGLTAVSNKGKWGIINTKGKFITALEYDYATSPSGERILVGKRQKDGTLLYGFLTMAGKVAITPQYEEAEEFSQGTAWVVKGGDGFFINKQGKMVEQKINLIDFP